MKAEADNHTLALAGFLTSSGLWIMGGRYCVEKA